MSSRLGSLRRNISLGRQSSSVGLPVRAQSTEAPPSDSGASDRHSVPISSPSAELDAAVSGSVVAPVVAPPAPQQMERQPSLGRAALNALARAASLSWLRRDRTPTSSEDGSTRPQERQQAPSRAHTFVRPQWTL